MLKARINGIDVEGTPEEMAALIKLVGEVKKAETVSNPWRDVTPSPHPGGTGPWRMPGSDVTWTVPGSQTIPFTTLWHNTGK